MIGPVRRRFEWHFDAAISAVIDVPEIDGLVFTNSLWFEATGAEGLLWRSRRVSWDGVRALKRNKTTLHGQAYDPMTSSWLAFELDLVTGEVVGGSYNGPPM